MTMDRRAMMTTNRRPVEDDGGARRPRWANPGETWADLTDTERLELSLRLDPDGAWFEFEFESGDLGGEKEWFLDSEAGMIATRISE
jgi:hypothetical protein